MTEGLFKKVTTIASIAITGVLTIAQLATATPDANEIMRRVIERDDGTNMTVNVEMTLTDKNGSKRVRRFNAFVHDADKVTTHRSYYFLAPPEVKDTAFLTYDYLKGQKDDDQWIYLPEIHKTKRIPSVDKSNAFMGSDFSYADMTKRVHENWTYELKGEDVVRGDKVWIIEAKSVSPKVTKEHGYDRTILFIRPDIDMWVRAIQYLTDGKVRYFDLTQVSEIQGIWTWQDMYVKTTKHDETLHQTFLRWRNNKYNNPGVLGEWFTTRQLERGIPAIF